MARVLALFLVLGTMGCDSTPAPAPEGDDFLRQRSNPIEFVGLSAARETNTELDVLAVLDPLFGARAASGDLHRDFEVQPGLLLTVTQDPRTAEQVVVQLDMVPAGATDRRTVLRVPASLEYGGLYIDVVRAAIARTAEVATVGTMHDWRLEYHSVSANGGFLKVTTAYSEELRRMTLTLETENPRTSLMPGEINTPAFSGDPWEKIAGTVYFQLSRDEFGFFSNRAYGTTSGAMQNFTDFQLQPHNWLRLTVVPQLDEEIVDVNFEVVTTDGRRVPVASAPASYIAGEQFQQNVFRMVDNMTAQETARPGSSTPFHSTFHYDDPEGGGVVRVIAEGEHGDFRIAYAVETPLQRLRDVDFVPYVGEIDLTQPVPRRTCAELGSRPADSGRFVATFKASETVRNSMELTDPLRGRVVGTIFRAEDVTIVGPRDGAVALGYFDFPDVDLTDPARNPEIELPIDVPPGKYQILGFMDIDGNAVPDNADPDIGDPVMLPIGSYELECARQPVVAEFALLLPRDL